MPLEPVENYDDPAYPTLSQWPEARRAFLRRIGLAAIAAALGPVATSCGGLALTANSQNQNTGTAVPPKNANSAGPPEHERLAGIAPPPNWPGPKGALVGGGPIEFTYKDGTKGWAAVAVVFRPNDPQLEERLIDAEKRIVEAVRDRMKDEDAGALGNAARRDGIEDDLLAAIQKIANSKDIDSATIAEVTEKAAKGKPAARLNKPDAPAAAAPAAPAPAAAPPPRRLPRAGTSCPLHPEGCDASEHSGGT